MTSPEPENRVKILDAAEELFARRGYAATSVREIVREANVTNPMLYYYFGSKEDLFAHLLSERLQQWWTRLQDASSSCTTPYELFVTWIRLIIHAARERPVTLRFMYTALLGPREGLPVAFIRDRHVEMARGMMAQLARVSPETTKERRRFVTLMLQGMIDTFVFFEMETGQTSPVDDVAHALAARAIVMLGDSLPLPELPAWEEPESRPAPDGRVELS